MNPSDKDLDIVATLLLRLWSVRTLQQELYSIAGNVRATIRNGEYPESFAKKAQWFEDQAFSLNKFVDGLNNMDIMSDPADSTDPGDVVKSDEKKPVDPSVN